MAQLDGLGVCGARLNIGRRYQESTSRDAIVRSIARVREIGWHLRLHVTGDDIIPDSAFLKSIKDITVVVDHMGHLHLDLGLEQPACRWLVDMLRNEGWWMMLSNGNRDPTWRAAGMTRCRSGRPMEAAPTA